MKYMVDLVILTDSRYVAPKKTGAYVENVLLEDRLVQEALNAEGLRVARRSWDDPDFDWSTTRYALFRSTWDYFERFGEFSDWFEKAAQQTQFINSGDLIRWNMDKHYLQSLSRAGINVPGTLFVEKGSATTLADAHGLAIRQKGFQNPEFVLKPCVSGGGGHTYRIALAEIPQREALFAELIASEAMMLQEFQENIVSQGEYSLMVFEGIYSHAVLKKAKEGDFRVQDNHGGTVHPHTATAEQIAMAEKVVRAAPELPLYARVDIFRDNGGHWALAELEIFEPELWFRMQPGAARAMAKAIVKRFFA